MKKIIIIVPLFIYFCFAFIMWQWNPSQWDESQRLLFIICLTSGLIIVYPINEIIKLDKKN